MKKCFFWLLPVFISAGCQKANQPPAATPSALFFPPVNSSAHWETISPDYLGWNEAELPNLYSFQKRQRAEASFTFSPG